MRNIFIVLMAMDFAFCSCRGVSANIERRNCSYCMEEFEHVLGYRDSDGFHSLCLEEAFDLAEGEIVGFERFSRAGGVSFTLYSKFGFHYILNVNNDGSLVLHRFD